MRSVTFALLAFMAAALAACGGTTYVYETPQPNIPTPTMHPTTQPTGAASSTVSFLVIVPAATGGVRHRPNVVVPSSSQSVSILLDSVNGTPSTNTPTIANLSASATNCEATSAQLSCAINVSAPVGTLVYTLTVFSAANGTGSTLGAGNLAVTTTAGATVSAPATLSGTVAKIVLSVSTAPFGASATLPVTVQGEDAKGATVLGTYANPIVVTDSDPSAQTSLSSSASNVTSSQVAVMLTYAGGAMNAPATIGATAANVNPSNVTPTTFSPNQTYPTVNNAVTTFAYTQTGMSGTNGPPSGAPITSSGSYTVTVATGQSFSGATNLVQMNGLLAASAGLPSTFTNCCNYQNLVAYYAWTPQNSGSSLGLVGMTSSSDFTLTCVSPYSKQIVVPLTAGWNVRSGSAPCTSTYNDFAGNTDVAVLNADGSYTDTGSVVNCCGYTLDLAVNSDGSTAQTLNEVCGCGSSSIIAVSVPSPGASVVPVALQTFPGAIPSPGSTTTPSPVATSVPNPWSISGISIPGSKIPNPLESDTFTVASSAPSLPSECAIPAALLGTNPTLTEADETVILADPGEDWNQFYYATQTITHYYLDGVGEICNKNVLVAAMYDNHDFTSYYLGSDTSYDTFAGTTWSYVTATTLMATSARRREAAAAFTMATYALAHGPMPATQRTLDPRHAFLKKH
ncbi:MAG: hypothetical protein WBD74_09225 [Candidatus Aquilonibacter sp.]